MEEWYPTTTPSQPERELGVSQGGLWPEVCILPPSQHRWQRRHRPRRLMGPSSEQAALATHPIPQRRPGGKGVAGPTAGVGGRRGGSALARGRGAHPSPVPQDELMEASWAGPASPRLCSRPRSCSLSAPRWPH